MKKNFFKIMLLNHLLTFNLFAGEILLDSPTKVDKGNVPSFSTQDLDGREEYLRMIRDLPESTKLQLAMLQRLNLGLQDLEDNTQNLCNKAEKINNFFNNTTEIRNRVIMVGGIIGVISNIVYCVHNTRSFSIKQPMLSNGYNLINALVSGIVFYFGYRNYTLSPNINILKVYQRKIRYNIDGLNDVLSMYTANLFDNFPAKDK